MEFVKSNGSVYSALYLVLSGKIVKRECIKNDTVIISHKNRLYQLCQNTGIRYPYVLTNADIHAKDWIEVISLDSKNEMYKEIIKGKKEIADGNTIGIEEAFDLEK